MGGTNLVCGTCGTDTAYAGLGSATAVVLRLRSRSCGGRIQTRDGDVRRRRALDGSCGKRSIQNGCATSWPRCSSGPPAWCSGTAAPSTSSPATASWPFFGAPVALEDHAFRACLAALDIQHALSTLAAEALGATASTYRLRIGLNSGRVIAGDIDSGPGGYTAVGVHVGMAQRMESAAPPGGVMISESTAHLVSHIAVLGEPETVRIKGSDSPVTAYRLLGTGDPGAIAATTPRWSGAHGN